VSRVALVTGGTRGIGYGIAASLAGHGYDLLLSGRRSAAEVAEALAGLRATGVAVHYLPADVARREERARLVEWVDDRAGAVNLLVNNAGVAPTERRDILAATEESFDRVLGTNLKGPYFLTQALAARMVAARRADPGFTASIVFVTSVSATVASVNRGEYCLSKAALSMAVQLWAVRLAEHGIGVFEVRPGVIRTDMTAGVADRYDRLIAEGLIPQGRWGWPEDVGRAVAAIARGDLAYSTGQVIMIDGGMTLGRL
jgi:3-oxoacyl-[acyl-carrier protein] reductase